MLLKNHIQMLSVIFVAVAAVAVAVAPSRSTGHGK
jgi:hypothetical protein